MNMSGYELRRHLAGDHDIHVAGLAFAELTDIHAGEHFPDRSRPASDHDHDEDERGDRQWTQRSPLTGPVGADPDHPSLT
jgi:hypothetical protein